MRIGLVLLLIASAQALADEAGEFRVGGLLFGDVYHIPSHHTAAGDGATGVVLRRGYFTADFGLNDTWRGRVRIEVNQDGEFESYGFEADFKDLFLARDFGRHEFVIGLSPTLTFDLIESVWGARYLMRTPMDLQGVPSRDSGFSFRGPLTKVGRLSYRFMLGAGVEFGSETSDGAKWMGALTWRTNAGLILDGYLDYEKLPGRTDRSTIQLFLGKKTELLRWGVQYSNEDRQDDPRLELASAFVIASVREKYHLVGRVDRIMEPSPKGDNISYIPFDPSARATMLLGGIEYQYSPVFRITPNIIWTSYDRNDQGARPDPDVHLRITFFLDLE